MVPSVLVFHQGGGGAAAGISQGPGTAIADNKAVRGDTSGVQGSGITISDADAVSGVTQFDVDNLRFDGNTISSTSGNINVTSVSGGGVVVTATGNSLMEFNITGNQVMYFKTQNANRWTIDANGKLKAESAGSKVEMIGGLIWKGKTETALPPAITDFASGECGIHKDTNLNKRQLVWNDGGTLYGVELPAL